MRLPTKPTITLKVQRVIGMGQGTTCHWNGAVAKMSVDTRFCNHDLIKEDDKNDHSCIQNS